MKKPEDEENDLDWQAGYAAAEADFAEIDALVERRGELVGAHAVELWEQLPEGDKGNVRMMLLARMIAHGKFYNSPEDEVNAVQDDLLFTSDLERILYPFEVQGYAWPLPFHIDGSPMYALTLFPVAPDEGAEYFAFDSRVALGQLNDQGRVTAISGWSQQLLPKPGEQLKLEVTVMVGDFPPYFQVWDSTYLHRPDQRRTS